MRTRHEPLCLEETVRLWTYLPNFKLNQNWLLAYRNLLLKEREPKDSKLYSYWHHSNVSLILSMTKEKRAAITASARKQNWKYGNTKINIASFIPLKMTKFQKFWIPEYFLYQCILLTQPKVSTIIFTSKVSFAAESHLMVSVWQSTARETSHTFIACFLVAKIMLIYAKIQQLT